MGLELLSPESHGGSACRPFMARTASAILRLGMVEARRLLKQRRFWALVVVIAGLGTYVMPREVKAASLGSGLPVSAQLALLDGIPFLALAVPAMPFLLGGTLAEDRRTGYTPLLLARGMGRTGVICAKVTGIVAAATLFSALVTILLTLGAIAVALWSASPGTGKWIAFAPGLLDRAPVAFLTLCAGVYALVFATFGAVATLVATINAGRMVAETVPTLVFLAVAMGMPASWSQLNPYLRADFVAYHASWNTPGSLVAYWAAAFALACLLASFVYRFRDGA